MIKFDWFNPNANPVWTHLFYRHFLQELFEQWDKSKSTDISQNQDSQLEDLSDEEELMQADSVKEGREAYSSSHRYFPPVVGQLKSLKEVHDRVAGNMETFSQLTHP